jgi:hypothetical protein
MDVDTDKQQPDQLRPQRPFVPATKELVKPIFDSSGHHSASATSKRDLLMCISDPDAQTVPLPLRRMAFCGYTG